MDKSLVLSSIKIVIIVLVFVIFYIVVQNNLTVIKDDFVNYDNKFKYKASNTRIVYQNTGGLPWKRHTIQSSIPFDVKLKNIVSNAHYYEFDNKTYSDKLKEVFKSNCEELIIATEGSSWGKWLKPKAEEDAKTLETLLTYYNSIYSFVYDRLNASVEMQLPGLNNERTIQIVHDILLRFRKHTADASYYMFDIEMILYREGKLQGKHVKIVAVCNGKKINIILTRIIGVVSEDQIALYPYVGVDYMNNMNFDTFIPVNKGLVDSEGKNSKENTFLVKDDYLYNEIEDILYKKLLEANNVEDTDISNNNYIPKKEELVKKNACTL